MSGLLDCYKLQMFVNQSWKIPFWYGLIDLKLMFWTVKCGEGGGVVGGYVSFIYAFLNLLRL